MNVIERILGKLVGQEMTVEEMEMVSGGTDKACDPKTQQQTSYSGDKPSQCDPL